MDELMRKAGMNHDLTGRVNGWRCDTCGRLTYVVHVHDGVTPMFLACRASGDLKGCEGMGISLMYPDAPIPDHVREAVAFEWYRPTPKQTRRMDEGMRDHIERGGLALRPLTDAGRSALNDSPPSQGTEANDG